MCPGRAANTAVLTEGQCLLINDPGRFEGVRVIGVDEHVWRHTPYGDKYVTVILDLTPIRDRSGPSRLLDMIPGLDMTPPASQAQADPERATVHPLRRDAEPVNFSVYGG